MYETDYNSFVLDNVLDDFNELYKARKNKTKPKKAKSKSKKKKRSSSIFV